MEESKRKSWDAAGKAQSEQAATRRPVKFLVFKVVFNLKSEVGVGGMGDPPVPSGHWPDGSEGAWTRLGRTKAVEHFFPFHAASRRAAQADGLCYPAAAPPLLRGSG